MTAGSTRHGTRPRQNLDFSFDKRVSDQYDAQRAHPPEVATAIGAAIAELTGAAATILELGVGTGRIALPVRAAGPGVVGIDISGEMLQLLQQRQAEQGHSEQIDLVQCDVCKLPFADGAFTAVTSVHVLHLIEAWQDALTSMAATVAPGGLLILGRDWTDPKSMAGSMQNGFRRAVIDAAGPQLKAPTGGQVIAEKITALGFAPVHTGKDDLVAAEWQIDTSPTEFIDAVERRANPESWILSDELMAPVLQQLRAFTAEKWPDLNERHSITRRFLLTVYRKAT